jgi:hypothetical protein
MSDDNPFEGLSEDEQRNRIAHVIGAMSYQDKAQASLRQAITQLVKDGRTNEEIADALRNALIEHIWQVTSPSSKGLALIVAQQCGVSREVMAKAFYDGEGSAADKRKLDKILKRESDLESRHRAATSHVDHPTLAEGMLRMFSSIEG